LIDVLDLDYIHVNPFFHFPSREKEQNRGGRFIVDDGGHLLYPQRLDETQTGSIEVAIQAAKDGEDTAVPGR
jgi:hypothetical protein